MGGGQVEVRVCGSKRATGRILVTLEVLRMLTGGACTNLLM